jgi:iron(III) transport system substrate-binding protein
VLDLVDSTFRSPSGAWVGVTGRVRVLAYNVDVLEAVEVPDSVFDLTAPQWRGRVGWAPENGSFQAFVTAMRLAHGDEQTRAWLEAMVTNEAVAFTNNTGAIEGVARGEVDVALVNHYYLYRFLAEDPGFPVANHYLPGDIGGLVNVAGAGVLDTSEQPGQAEELIRFLLSEDTQAYFGQVTDALEFPLRSGVDSPDLPSLASLDPPQVDLSRLDDLQATLEMLHEVGALA